MEKSCERKFRSAKRSRKRLRSKQLVPGRASKRALYFGEPSKFNDEAVYSNAAVELVSEEVAHETVIEGLQ